ncbi:MAG: uroporphyrinogen-III C-methyltransferase [Gammaproteobacteria bacterium]|nr:uroporphyrinogen-III C-methyltransferase [Gammaproteobacteria bacterium]
MSCRGSVYLVGAGPGDPDLLTVKAQRLLRQADVVVYDRLVSAEILGLISHGIARICVGKGPGNHSLRQQEINHLLVRLAHSRRCIVRLKGGDPFVFGRGSEEAQYLRSQGIEFEVVPGITAATACAAYAGIPLTHRGLSRGVHFVTGHRRNNEPLDLDWSKLADPEQTLVVYMGLATVAEICRELRAAGLSSHTPAAAIENGTTCDQRRCLGTLADLPHMTTSFNMKPPVLLVIGQVVKLAQQLDWFITKHRAVFSAEVAGASE